MMQKTSTRILGRQSTGGYYYLLQLGYPFATAALPGQFIMLGASGLQDPFLKRPYSICRAVMPDHRNPEGRLDLLIKDVGRGSHQMRQLPIGTQVELVGPLGKPFTIDSAMKSAIFVAGGIGVAPFVELAAHPKMKNVRKVALIGGRSKVDVQAIRQLEELNVNVRVATEDGSLGKQGLVTALLTDIIATGVDANTELFCCGPEPMMKAVGKIALEHKLSCQLSLEAIMGCGFGVCLGCVTKDDHGNFVRVCKEGPVFQAQELSDYGRQEVK